MKEYKAMRGTTLGLIDDDARLRRSQAMALSNGLGLELSRKLIDAKLDPAASPRS